VRDLTSIEKLFLYVMHPPRTKDACASILGATTKTVENTVNGNPGIILYDKKIHRYRLEGYLPLKIPTMILYFIARDRLKAMGLDMSPGSIVDVSVSSIDTSELSDEWMQELLNFMKKKGL